MSSFKKKMSASNILFKYRKKNNKMSSNQLTNKNLRNSINDLETELKKLKKYAQKKKPKLTIKNKPKKNFFEENSSKFLNMSSSKTYSMNFRNVFKKKKSNVKENKGLKAKFYDYMDSSKKRHSIYRTKNCFSSSNKNSMVFTSKKRNSNFMTSSSNFMNKKKIKEETENEFIFI